MLLVDVLVFAAILAGIYAVLATAKYWMGVVTPAAHISRSPAALPAYAFYSLVRMAVAYVLSLVFAVAYGYIAANNRRVEMVMIAVLDILQSIPVLSFLPGVMLAMVALFPTRQLGVELGSIILIFTGQVWNMAFSFYSSLKSIPRELREAALINHFSAVQRFVELELPFGTIGLVWNSIVSMAGGWFFLMACEMFVLGKHDFRLAGPGLLFADCGEHRRYGGNRVGAGGHDCGDRAARSTGVAARHRLVGEIQDGAGGERRGSHIADSPSAAQLGCLTVGRETRRRAALGTADHQPTAGDIRAGRTHVAPGPNRRAPSRCWRWRWRYPICL